MRPQDVELNKAQKVKLLFRLLKKSINFETVLYTIATLVAIVVPFFIENRDTFTLVDILVKHIFVGIALWFITAIALVTFYCMCASLLEGVYNLKVRIIDLSEEESNKLKQEIYDNTIEEIVLKK